MVVLRSVLSLAVAMLLASSAVAVPAAAQEETSPLATDDEAADQAEAPVGSAADFVVVEGLGNGHGWGMGQWGSFGYAVDHFWSYRQIVEHFYGGTTNGFMPDRNMGVQLTRYDGQTLGVHSSERFSVAGRVFAPGQYARVRIVGDGTFAIERGPSCAGPWTVDGPAVLGWQGPGPAGDNRAVEMVPSRFNYGSDAAGLLTVCGEERAFRGALRVVEQGGTPRMVNVLAVEQYLRGVVPRESPASWGRMPSGLGIDRGMHALQAQAVAARSYVYALGAIRAARGTYIAETCDSQSCQVYSGAWVNGTPLDHGPVYDTTNLAISRTAGEVRTLLSNGQVALTTFASSTGGWTSRRSEGNGFDAVPDAGDATASNPHHPWQVQIPRTAIEAAYPQIGTLLNITVSKRNGLGEWGGRVQQILIDGTAGRVVLDIPNWAGDTFRQKFGLRSDWYRFIQQASPPSGSVRQGIWVVRPNGAVYAFGGAVARGDLRNVALFRPVVGMAATPSGNGYWLVASDGGVFAYGDARFFGSTGGMRLNRPVVGMAATPSGNGYWLVASDGGVFAYGDARFFGSTGGMRLNRPVVGMAVTPSGNGYWLVASDGGIFAYGDARYSGSLASSPPWSGVAGMAPSASGQGYLIVDRIGQVASFGDAQLFGDRSGRTNRGTVVDITSGARGVSGYYLLTDQAVTYSFGAVTDFPSSTVGGPVVGMAAVGSSG